MFWSSQQLLISEKTNFKINTRDKKRYYMIMRSIQEDTAIVNIYACNIQAPQYIRQMLTSRKGETNSNKTTGGL